MDAISGEETGALCCFYITRSVVVVPLFCLTCLGPGCDYCTGTMT